jgi:hypothetical protein
MHPLPHPEGNGTRPVSPARQPATPASGRLRPAAGGVSRLDRVTLQLGVAVAVVIAVCSYAVSATSLYALGIQAGYSWWQAAAVPVVADGPAIYGMFRMISRSRPRPTGAGRPGHRRRHPPGRPGHARRIEGRRRRGHPPGHPSRCRRPHGHPRPDRPAPAGDDGSTRRPHHQATPVDGDLRSRAAGAARRAEPTAKGTVGARLQAAYAQPRPDGQPWTARTLAEAAGCGRSSAASFLQRQRPSTAEDAR